MNSGPRLPRRYITEKLGRGLLNRLLPVVLGATLDEVTTVAPGNSFLHVDNFTSPRQLAEYLHYLDKNDDAYNRCVSSEKRCVLLNECTKTSNSRYVLAKHVKGVRLLSVVR